VYYSIIHNVYNYFNVIALCIIYIYIVYYIYFKNRVDFWLIYFKLFVPLRVFIKYHINVQYKLYQFKIRDGDNSNSTIIALLCGNIEKLPKLPYLSTHNYMWLKFSTKSLNSIKGFQANYSTIDISKY